MTKHLLQNILLLEPTPMPLLLRGQTMIEVMEFMLIMEEFIWLVILKMPTLILTLWVAQP